MKNKETAEDPMEDKDAAGDHCFTGQGRTRRLLRMIASLGKEGAENHRIAGSGG
jgi:hypothetical protein